MQKRYIKKLDMELSPLGFGLMRLPMDNDWFTAEAYRMIDHAMEAGINYYDTAYHYQNYRSEEFVRDALVKKYPRKTFYIADKLPVWLCKNKDDMERIFQMQLEKLGVRYIDLYLLHALYKQRWLDIYSQGVLDFLELKKKEGQIRKVGFSLHDNTETLIDIEKAFDWDFAQLQINYYDWTVQHADESYELLVEKEIPCIVMEPVGGGRLSKLPEAAERLLKNAHPNASVSSWALRFAASLPNVAVTLSGMSTVEQLQDNISSFSPAVPMSDDERKVLDEVVRVICSHNTIPCSSCGYCVDDCPKTVDIQQIFQRYNDSKMFDHSAHFTVEYLAFIYQNNRAGGACVKCGKCVKKCPQAIDIPTQLGNIHRMVASDFLGIDAEGLKRLAGSEPNSILVCFGAGERGRISHSLFRENGINVRCFCDNSERLWGREVCGIPVISPAELCAIAKRTKVNLFIASNSYSVIKTQLKDLNVLGENLVLINYSPPD